MICQLTGLLLEAKTGELLLEVAGIGYRLLIGEATYALLPALGSACRLYTVHLIRPETQLLYGFIRRSDRDLFDLLLTANGVGPKMALGLLDHFSGDELIDAIEAGDVASLCRVPGLGKKSSEKLLFALKDKVSGFPRQEPLSSPLRSLLRSSTAALMTLGYEEGQARKVVEQLLKEREELPRLPDLLNWALSALQR